MGLRWYYDPSDDCAEIKFSGIITDAAMQLGYLTKSEEFEDCFCDETVTLTKAQVEAICKFVWTHYQTFMMDRNSLDYHKVMLLEKWADSANDKDTIFFA